MKKLFKKKYAHIRFFITYNIFLVLFLHNGSFHNPMELIKDLFYVLFAGFAIAMLHYGVIEELIREILNDFDDD